MSDKLGVGIISYDRPQCLERSIAAFCATGKTRDIVVVHTGVPWGVSALESCAVLDGVHIQHIVCANYLPHARAMAEVLLVEAGCNRFMITDDDVVPVRIESAGALDVVGGACRTCWRANEMLDDVAYLKYLDSDNPIPGGRVEPKTAVYGGGLLGLWEKVASRYVEFDIEDLAWCYLVHKAGGRFTNQGFVAYHAPPEAIKGYDLPRSNALIRMFKEATDQVYK